MNPSPPPIHSAGIRLFIMMVLQFFIWGAWLPLIWSYMGGLGFTGTQIAWVGSGFAIASILAIFAGNQFVDRRFSASGSWQAATWSAASRCSGCILRGTSRRSSP